MTSAYEKNWQLAGPHTGQGVRRVAPGGQALLIIDSVDEPLAIQAAAGSPCEHNPQHYDLETATLVCRECGAHLDIPGPGSVARRPVMVVDNEIYVLLDSKAR